jgi:CBS domain containing-hemolysin-like protein
VLKLIPETGERFTVGEWKFVIVDMDGRKIDKMLDWCEPRREG